jgi:hypothetical protein
MPKSRRYLIEITELATGNIVAFTGADWTDDERRNAVGLVLRLAGRPGGGCFTEPAKPEGD